MKISVVIPTYQRPELLRRLLHSVQGQTYRNFEVIVVDDHSNDQESYERVVAEFSKTLPQLSYLRNDRNLGAPHSRNRGIKQASGEWIALVDDDDEWLPEKLAKQVNVVVTNPSSLGLVYTWAKAIENEQVVWIYESDIEGDVRSQILLDCFIPSPSVLAKREALLKAGLFDEKLPSCQDWDMWTRLLHAGYTSAVVRDFLAIYHKHDGDTIGASPNASLGYQRYYKKHRQLYKIHHPRIYYKDLIKRLVKILCWR